MKSPELFRTHELESEPHRIYFMRGTAKLGTANGKTVTPVVEWIPVCRMFKFEFIAAVNG